MDTKVEYLGHIIDTQGIHTDVRKDEVICNAVSREPGTVSNLRILGSRFRKAMPIKFIVSHYPPAYTRSYNRVLTSA